MCPLTPGFLNTLCIINPRFLILASIVFRYLYSHNHELPVILAFFFLFGVFFVVCIGFDLYGPSVSWLVIQLLSMDPHYQADWYPEEHVRGHNDKES